MGHAIKFFVRISFLFFFLNNSHIYSVIPGLFVGLGGGTSRVAAVQNQFGWDFHIRAGFWTPFFDLGASVGGVGAQTKIDPITGKKSSGVTTAGGSFEEVTKEVTYNLYLLPVEVFLTGKFPVSDLFLITGTFALGAFLDALGSTVTPTKATPIETRDTVFFDGYSLMDLLGVEFNFTVFLDGGYRYSEPTITTEVPEGDQVVNKTFKQMCRV